MYNGHIQEDIINTTNFTCSLADSGRNYQLYLELHYSSSPFFLATNVQLAGVLRACQLIPQGYAATRVPPGSTRNPVQFSKGRISLSWVLMGNGMTPKND